MKEFAIVKPITKPIDEYVSNTPHVVAYRQLPEGNASNFIYSVNGPVPFARARYGEIDMEKYQELLSSSLIELVRGVGLGLRRHSLFTAIERIWCGWSDGPYKMVELENKAAQLL